MAVGQRASADDHGFDLPSRGSAEQLAAFADGFAIGVVPREHEDAIARRVGVQRWPSQVFLRGGGHLGMISGLRDWDDDGREVGALLARDVSRVPSVGIPVVASGSGADICH